jgi:hypothetical protein
MLVVKALLVDFDGTACVQDGVTYRPWETFDEVRAALEESDALPGPVGSERCPGWRIS